MLRKCLLSCIAPTPYTYQVVKDEKERLSLESPSKAKGIFVLPGSPVFNPPDRLKLEYGIISHFDENVAPCICISGRSIGQKFRKVVFLPLSELKTKVYRLDDQAWVSFQCERSVSHMFLEAVFVVKPKLQTVPYEKG